MTWNHSPLCLDAKYEAVNPRQVAEAQIHLSPSQCKELGDLLCKFPRLFDGTLRSYQGPKVHLELKEGAQLVHQRAHPVPDANLEAFKKELAHLCQIGVLEPCGPSDWASRTFIIPKKDG